MDEEKEEVFKRFNDLQSYDEQTLFLQNLCRPKAVEHRRKRIKNGGKDRSVTFNYNFEVERDGEVQTVKVCKIAFLNNLGIKQSRIRQKVQENRVNYTDNQGKHDNRPKRISADALEKVREFIRNLPARESHWSRRKSTRRIYLDSNITITGLYTELISKHPELAGVIKQGKFYGVFSNEFNIGIGYPRSDICDSCELIKVKIDKAILNKNKEEEINQRTFRSCIYVVARRFTPG